MGAGVSRPKKANNTVSLSELNDGSVKEIKEVKDLTISQADFVLEKNGRFRDFYQIGPTLGAGSFGEVRKGINKVTKQVRAVKIIRKDFLKGNEKLRFFYEMEIMK